MQFFLQPSSSRPQGLATKKIIGPQCALYTPILRIALRKSSRLNLLYLGLRFQGADSFSIRGPRLMVTRTLYSTCKIYDNTFPAFGSCGLHSCAPRFVPPPRLVIRFVPLYSPFDLFLPIGPEPNDAVYTDSDYEQSHYLT